MACFGRFDDRHDLPAEASQRTKPSGIVKAKRVPGWHKIVYVKITVSYKFFAEGVIIEWGVNWAISLNHVREKTQSAALRVVN
jgi:hypothetical protein